MSTALAERPPEALPAKVITNSEAIAIVKRVAGERLKVAKDAHRAKVRELERAVGGQTSRVDDTVVGQAKQLMQRIALIAKRRESRYTGGYSTGGGNNAQLEKIVGKLGGIVGELEAFMLTNKAVGLFEAVEDRDFVGSPYTGGGRKVNPLDYASRKTRKLAEEALAGYTIVDDPKKTKKGAGEIDLSTGRSVDELAGDAALEDEELIDDEDEELADDDD
jgi:hypothetical protein